MDSNSSNSSRSGGQGDSNAGFEPDHSVENIQMEMKVPNISNMNGQGKQYSKDMRLPMAKNAVVIRGATKRYGSGPPVLRNMNMTVEQGSIYSLLGSSGCGKTTILSCCVGLLKLNRGTIQIFGHLTGSPECGVPGKNVGFMPQDTSLYDVFTIKEILTYYGRMYGMDDMDISDRINFLVDFLRLPYMERRVGTLSGGQQRRVSFAVALIHEPPLLILDEPTVGVDPLLRKSIWDHLVKLVVSSKTTVIITTHYIEEARTSNRVGLMRHGHLLVEDSPSDLLVRYKTNLLEDIVLLICLKEQKKDDPDIEQTSTDATNSQNEFEPDSKPEGPNGFSFHHDPNSSSNPTSNANGGLRGLMREVTDLKFSRIKSLATKNAIFMLRNILFLGFVFLLPGIQMAVICMAIGNDPKKLDFGIVNNEVRNYNDCLALPTDTCGSGNLSCLYIKSLSEDDIVKEFYDTEGAARKAVEGGKIWGYMVVPEKYTENIYANQQGQNVSAGSAQLAFEMDMSNNLIGRNLQRIFLENYEAFINTILISCNIDPTAKPKPLEFRTPIYGDLDTDFREFLAVSLLIAILFFFPLVTSGLLYIMDRKQGTLGRSLVAGARETEVMISYLISEGTVLCFQVVISLFVVVVIFDITIKGSIILAGLICLLVGLSGISMGFLSATVCTEAIEAVLLSLGFFLPNVILAGVMWPLEAMPEAVQYFSYLLPCTLASEAMRSIVSRGWGMSHIHVYGGFLATIGWILAYWTLNVLIRKLRK